MKNFSVALVIFIAVSLTTPLCVAGQQTRRQQPSVGSTSGRTPGKTPGGTTMPAPRGSRHRATVIDPSGAVEQDLSEALTTIRENYVDGNKLDYSSIFKSSIIGMLRSLDPHSNYYDRNEFDELKTDQRSEYFGIGASIQSYTIGDQTDTYIAATFEKTPAARAGLRFGDRIVEVNGEKMHDKSSAEVRDKIRGERGSVVKVTVDRGSTGRPETVEMRRDAVPQPSIPDAYLLGKGIGYIDMTHGFNYTTSDELQAALDDLHSKGMTSLVLDLRNNPGGFLDQAIHVAEKFLPNGEVILTQKGRNGLGDRIYRSENTNPDMTPMAVLVNGSTASASEIVAGAMQDHDRALVVGQTSFGKGLVQSIIPLEFGAGLTLTSAKYYTPSGRLIQRDYSNGDFYNYYTRGGSTRIDSKDNVQPTATGPESRTDTGRVVYGGGGISPDESVKGRAYTNAQTRLLSPIFFFAREIVNARVKGFESYRVQRGIEFNHALVPSDFPMTDALFKSFRTFLATHPSWAAEVALVDHNRNFVEQELRYNLVTAAYGKVMADRVRISRNSTDVDDPQVQKSIDALPRARQLEARAIQTRSQR